MNARLIQSQKRLHDSLFDLYMQGGQEMVIPINLSEKVNMWVVTIAAFVGVHKA